MSFLPEEDQEFLDGNGLQYELLTAKTPEGTERRGVLLPGFAFVGDLRTQGDGALTTKLDSFYTIPRLKRPDGSDPQNANGEPA
jgi:hypothetical protein